MNDARVLLRGLPQRAVQILGAGYKLLLPPVLSGGHNTGTERVVDFLREQVGTVSRLGTELPDIISDDHQQRRPVPRKESSLSSTPAELREEASSLLKLLKQTLNARARLVVDYNKTFVNMCRSSHKVARDAVQRQSSMLNEYNDTVADICQRQLLQQEDEEELNAGPLESSLDESFRSVLQKLGVPCTGLLARSDIPTHLKVQQLLVASDLSPDDDDGLVEAAQELPRSRIQSVLSELRQKVAQHKMLLMGGRVEGKTLGKLSSEIRSLRAEAQKEISKNAARTNEVLAQTLGEPRALLGGDSSVDLLKELGRASVLCHLHSQDKDVNKTRSQLECDTRTEMIQRQGVKAFDSWFTETFRSQLGAQVRNWSDKLQKRFLEFMRVHNNNVEHLCNELRCPRFHTLRTMIERRVADAYQRADREVLFGHRPVLASVVDFADECLRGLGGHGQVDLV